MQRPPPIPTVVQSTAQRPKREPLPEVFMASIDTSTVHPSELFGKELSVEVRRALTFCVSLEGIGVAEASLGLSL